MSLRFWKACLERDAIRSETKPLRDQYDAVSQEIDRLRREKLEPLKAELKVKEAPLFDLDMEIGALSRALGGKPDKPGA